MSKPSVIIEYRVISWIQVPFSILLHFLPFFVNIPMYAEKTSMTFLLILVLKLIFVFLLNGAVLDPYFLLKVNWVQLRYIWYLKKLLLALLSWVLINFFSKHIELNKIRYMPTKMKSYSGDFHSYPSMFVHYFIGLSITTTSR